MAYPMQLPTMDHHMQAPGMGYPIQASAMGYQMQTPVMAYPMQTPGMDHNIPPQGMRYPTQTPGMSYPMQPPGMPHPMQAPDVPPPSYNQQKEEEDVGQGLIVVYDKLASKPGKHDNDAAKKNYKSIEKKMIDIIAVPGLEADPKQTWIKRRRIANRVGDDAKNYKDGPSCIADPTMLPDIIPNSRIMTFSYASDWRGVGKNEQHQPVNQRVEMVAEILLRELKNRRKNCLSRPILILGHSLGGVIVEKVVTKSKIKAEYLDIYTSIAGCIFLGTPFEGSESQAKAALAAKAGAVAGLAEYTPLLELMKKNSRHLSDLLRDFLDVVQEAKIQVYCFFELQESDVSGFYRRLPLGSFLPAQMELIADEKGSTLQGHGMRGLNRNHFDLNKFDNNTDREWLALSAEIDRMASRAPKALKERRNALPDKIDNEKYLELLTTLTAEEANPEADIRTIESQRGQAVEESATLLFQNKAVQHWFEAIPTSMLWISLPPGHGSAMMAVAIHNRIEDDIKLSRFDDYLCYFFCDSKNVKKNNTLSILKAFIRQLLQANPRLALHLPYEQQRTQSKNQSTGSHTSWDSFANLRLAFLAMLKDPLVHCVTLVIDSLHKIDEDSRPDMLDLIDESIHVATSPGAHSAVKWICLGVERDDISLRMKQALTVTSKDLGTQQELNNSLKTLVRDRVIELSDKLQYSREYIFWLRTELLNRAEGNATWVDLAIGEIASVKPKAIEVRSFAEHLKQDLTPLYRQIQARVLDPTNEGLEYTKEILRTMLVTYHNPRLSELAVLSGLPSDTWDDYAAIEACIIKCGSFLKIVSGEGERYDRVHFMDTTAQEYLKTPEAAVQLGHHGKLGLQHGIIALRCLNYLIDATDETHAAAKKRMAYPKRFWLQHAQEASKELPDLIEDLDLDIQPWFWQAGGSSWWPRFKALLSTWPKLNNLSVVHLAAFFNFPLLLDYLMSEDSSYKDKVDAQDSLGRTPLYWAANEGHFDMVQKLVKYGANINAVTTNEKEGLSALYAAADSGHIEIVHWLLTQGAAIDIPSDKYGTPLCGAANHGHTEVVDLLLRAGASKIAPPKWVRGSPLSSAAYFGHAETAKFMIRQGFDTNVVDLDGRYALQEAIDCEDPELILMLLQHGQVVNARQISLDAAALRGYEEGVQLILRDPSYLTFRQALMNVAQYGYTAILDHFPPYALTQQDLDDALYLACDMEKEETVKKLLYMGASANAQGEFYGNALQASAWDGTLDIMKLLVGHGAHVNATGGRYGTALQAAAYHGESDNVLFLLHSGASVNGATVGEYGNALYAAAAGNNKEIVQMLVEWGANINAHGGDLQYALLEAANLPNFEMVKYLVDHGADLRCTAPNGSNVILIGSRTLPKSDLEWLYQRGANVHLQTHDGTTALIACANYQDGVSVEWLLELGVNVNTVSIEFGSALQAAATRGNEEICEDLLKHGANCNEVSDHHAPPLLIAAEVDDEETFDVLLKYGADVYYRSELWGCLVEAAVQADAPEILAKILNHKKININALLRDQGTALHMSCLREYGKRTTMLLLERQADPNVVGGKYHTALQAAGYMGYSDLTNALLSKGADRSLRGGFYETAPNAIAARGWSHMLEEMLGTEGGSATDEALHYAVHYHKNDAVSNLLNELKADVSVQGKWGNVFQALSTALTDDEKNGDEQPAESTVNEVGNAENDDETPTGGRVQGVEYNDDEENEVDYFGRVNEEEQEEEHVLTDLERVELIDAMLREAFETKGVDHTKLPKEPLAADMKRSKSFMRAMKKKAEAPPAAGNYNAYNPHTNTYQTPAALHLDTSQRNWKGVDQPQQAAAGVGTGQFGGNSFAGPPPSTQAADSNQRTVPLQQSTQNVSSSLPTPSPFTRQARAVFPYSAKTGDEISLAQNEIVSVLDHTSNRNWWRVSKADGTSGYFPSNYIAMLQPAQQANAPSNVTSGVANPQSASTGASYQNPYNNSSVQSQQPQTNNSFGSYTRQPRGDTQPQNNAGSHPYSQPQSNGGSNALHQQPQNGIEPQSYNQSPSDNIPGSYTQQSSRNMQPSASGYSQPSQYDSYSQSRSVDANTNNYNQAKQAVQVGSFNQAPTSSHTQDETYSTSAYSPYSNNTKPAQVHYSHNTGHAGSEDEEEDEQDHHQPGHEDEDEDEHEGVHGVDEHEDEPEDVHRRHHQQSDNEEEGEEEDDNQQHQYQAYQGGYQQQHQGYQYQSQTYDSGW